MTGSRYGSRSGAAPLRLGLIGAGRWAAAHRSTFTEADAELIAVATVEASAARVRGAWGVPATTYLAELLASDIEAVVIASSNDLHAGQALRALGARDQLDRRGGSRGRLEAGRSDASLHGAWRGTMDVDPATEVRLVLHHAGGDEDQGVPRATGHAHDLVRQTRAYVAAARGGGGGPADANDGRAAVELCPRVAESLRMRGAIEIPG